MNLLSADLHEDIESLSGVVVRAKSAIELNKLSAL
jgi:hypothetical protein